MGVFDDILKAVPAEDQAVLNMYPQLKASVEKMETELSTVSRFAGDWLNWSKENWDADAGMTKRERQLQQELEDAQGRLAAASVAGSGASAQTIADLRKEFESKLKETQTQSLNAIEGMNLFYQATAKRMLPHQQEFGENLDPKALMGFMEQHKINDPDVAYDRMVAARRSELAEKRQKELDEQHKLEIQEAEKRGRDKLAQELAMGPSGALPTDNTGGIAGITAHVSAPAKVSDEVKAKVSEAKLGDGSLAQLGYEMYRRGELPVQ